MKDKASIFILFFVANFYIINICLAINPGDAAINEIAWMGTGISANDEWMELKNLSGSDINLEGWTLAARDGQPSITLSGNIAAGGFFLLERTDDESAPAAAADLIYGGALGNTGEILELKDSSGIMIDMIDAGLGWPGGDNETKQTLERLSDGNWKTSTGIGGSPGRVNPANTPVTPDICGDGKRGNQEECDDGNNSNGDGCSAQCHIESSASTGTDQEALPPGSQPDEEAAEEEYKLGDVVVNEFVSDPGDEDTEWVELYNTSNREVDLSGWAIEEGSGRKTFLSGLIAASGPEKYLLIENIKGNLNNAGDIIMLRDSRGSLIDIVSYGDWDDGNIDNNAPAAGDPHSTARKTDGYNTFNNQNDFCLTATLTKGISNIISPVTGKEEAEISREEMAAYDYSHNIIISEIFPDPEGPDSENEFVELFNKGETNVNLTGWRLGDESSRKYEIKKQVKGKMIKAKEYYVIYRTESKLALNNGSDSVMLYEPLKDLPLETVKYTEAKEGQSYSRQETPKNDWQWTQEVTPGGLNSFSRVNHPPTAAFDYPDQTAAGIPVLFDSSDTVDEDENDLEFMWDFGDQATNTLPCPEHTYWQAGAYMVKMTVSDKTSSSSIEKIINIAGSDDYVPALSAATGANNTDGLIINEFLPNPEGADAEGEFIEFFNNSSLPVNLYDWRVDDSEGGSKPFTFKDEFLLGPGKYYVLWREQSGLAFNNTSDAVRLFYGEELVEEIGYENTSEGEAYARGKNNKWFWTTAPTPGEENIISVAGSAEALTAAGKIGPLIPKGEKPKPQYSSTTLEKVRDFEAGDLVKVAGIVAVLPGVLGTQYFYIVGSPGLQVYNYKKEFPELRVGDYIEVSGELSVINTELRLKTKSTDDIRLAGFKGEPEAVTLECDKISEENIGELIAVAGEVVDRKSSNVYLDDGTDEIKVYIKTLTGIDPKNIAEGEMISVTGILGQTTGGLRLMPRFSKDIVKKGVESAGPGAVLGEVAVNQEWAIAARNKKIELFKYLLIAAGGIIVLLSGLIIKLELNKK